MHGGVECRGAGVAALYVTPENRRMQVEIYSDVVCPWCYIGERRFAQALSDFAGRDDVAVVFRPFQLDPSASATPSPLVESLRAKFGPNAGAMVERVTAVGAGEGIEFRFDDAVAVNTLSAHRLLRLAEQEYGAQVQRELAERLFDAHFTRGENVGDPALLTTLAAEVGMDRARVERYLASDEGLAETRDAIDRARELGISAVPSFVFDGQYLVEGGQPAETFAAVLEEVAARAEKEGAA
jgi:predicted DsbA family dithiol-disulfide isomerase